MVDAIELSVVHSLYLCMLDNFPKIIVKVSAMLILNPFSFMLTLAIWRNTVSNLMQEYVNGFR